jgi:hypothetical protein
MKPSIGRIVHFNGGPNAPVVAAIITAVHNDELVNLTIFSSVGATGGVENVKLGEGVGTWNWPPRV